MTTTATQAQTTYISSLACNIANDWHRASFAAVDGNTSPANLATNLLAQYGKATDADTMRTEYAAVERLQLVGPWRTFAAERGITKDTAATVWADYITYLADLLVGTPADQADASRRIDALRTI